MPPTQSAPSKKRDTSSKTLLLIAVFKLVKESL